MSERNDAAAKALERARKLPLLSDFGVVLPPLAEAGRDVFDSAFARVGERLGAPADPLSVQFRITTEDGPRIWHIEAGPDGCRVSNESGEAPGVEAILDADTWTLIATGQMSLLEAFGLGRMRVRGDINTARRFTQLLQRT